jgi:hypothetical protein
LNHLNHTFYFTGRSDNFDLPRLDRSATPGSMPRVRVSNDGTVFITDEYGPVYEFDS